MDKMNVKLERRSPSVSVKEESSHERPVAVDETTADDSEVDDEISDAETEDKAEQKSMSHQQAMEHFKDALAEIIVVCFGSIVMLINTPPRQWRSQEFVFGAG